MTLDELVMVMAEPCAAVGSGAEEPVAEADGDCDFMGERTWRERNAQGQEEAEDLDCDA